MRRQQIIGVEFDLILTSIRALSYARNAAPILFTVALGGMLFSQGQVKHTAPNYQAAGIVNWEHKDLALSQSLSQAVASAQASPAVFATLSGAQKNLAQHIARAYQVELEEIAGYIQKAYGVASHLKVDPLLVIALMSVESSFDPEAESNVGAQGLMQVLTRVHTEKFKPFGGTHAAFDISANIHVGTSILKEYLVREGSVAAALKSYVGAALMPDDGGYGWKVMSQRERFAAVAAGKPVPVIGDRAAPVIAASPKTEALPDLVTAKSEVEQGVTIQKVAAPVSVESETSGSQKTNGAVSLPLADLPAEPIAKSGGV
jgi:soluble lytic murein transglycosylase-like protein